MMHGISFVSPVKVYAGDYSDCKDADIIVITAGVAQKTGETRVDLLKRNTEVFKNITSEITKYCSSNVIILVVTNPVDILTYVTLKLSGFEQSKVIGSGTVLDTARLKYMLGEHTGIDPRNIHSYILGEHGDSEIAANSITSIAGMTTEKFCNACGKCGGKNMEEIALSVKNAGYEIINRKGSTYYAIALATQRILEAMVNDQNSILTVSSLLTGQYGINDVAISVPTLVNIKGAERILEIPLNDKEIKGLRDSADKLKSLIKEIGF